MAACDTCFHKDVCASFAAKECRYYHKETPRWIPVTERLPGYHKRVLVYVARFTSERVTYINTTVMAYLTDIGFICCEYGELLRGVAHWMPPPEPPEVE